jgi:hypothetical protein
MTKPHYFEHLEMLHDSEVDPKIGPVLAQMQELRAEIDRLRDLLRTSLDVIGRDGPW